MKFKERLLQGILVKRYKRFFVDIKYQNKIITGHCPNSGSMMGLFNKVPLKSMLDEVIENWKSVFYYGCKNYIWLVSINFSNKILKHVGCFKVYISLLKTKGSYLAHFFSSIIATFPLSLCTCYFMRLVKSGIK